MKDGIIRWLAAEIGPRLPIIRITGGNLWTEPGGRLRRAEVLALSFLITLAIIKGAANG